MPVPLTGRRASRLPLQSRRDHPPRSPADKEPDSAATLRIPKPTGLGSIGRCTGARGHVRQRGADVWPGWGRHRHAPAAGMLDLCQVARVRPGVAVMRRFELDGMKAEPDTRVAERPRKRWFAARWLAAAVVLLALGLANLSMADAHPASHPASPSAIGTAVDIGHDGPCCDETDARHAAGACSISGHCAACATVQASASVPPVSSTRRVGPGSTSLPAGRGSMPAKHPPKAPLPV